MIYSSVLRRKELPDLGKDAKATRFPAKGTFESRNFGVFVERYDSAKAKFSGLAGLNRIFENLSKLIISACW